MAKEMISVYDVPSRPINGMPRSREVHWVVPKGTWVTEGTKGRIFAEPGDHILGMRDAAGLSLGVFAGRVCPECERAALGKGSWPFE